MSSDKVVSREDIGRRLTHVLEQLGLSQNKAAQEFGVSQSFISAVVRGATAPSVTLLGACAARGLSINWLILGAEPMWQAEAASGPRVPAPPKPPLVELAEIALTLDEAAVEHLETYMRGYLAARERQPQQARAG